MRQPHCNLGIPFVKKTKHIHIYSVSSSEPLAALRSGSNKTNAPDSVFVVVYTSCTCTHYAKVSIRLNVSQSHSFLKPATHTSAGSQSAIPSFWVSKGLWVMRGEGSFEENGDLVRVISRCNSCLCPKMTDTNGSPAFTETDTQIWIQHTHTHPKLNGPNSV